MFKHGLYTKEAVQERRLLRELLRQSRRMLGTSQQKAQTMGILINLRHERFAQALAQGKAANEAYALAGYKANDGNASRLKGNERISARVQEIVGRAAERAEVSLERILRELAAIAFSNITKAVTWSCEEEEDGQRVKILPVPSVKLDEDTAAAISAVSQSSTGALRIKMHNKLAALVVLGKYLGMFAERPQNSNVIYAISDEPMSAEQWKKQFAGN
jgi:phage terminase small subunit